MANRAPEKAKRTPPAKAAKATPVPSRPSKPEAGGDASAALAERIAVLEAERAALAGELETAKARIAKLEEARAQVINRIDWVIDSLHNLLEDEG